MSSIFYILLCVLIEKRDCVIFRNPVFSTFLFYFIFAFFTFVQPEYT